MFLPLIPSQPAGSHDVGHFVGFPARGVTFRRSAIRWPAVFVLGPEAVQCKSESLTRVTLRGISVVAFQFAPAGRPAKGHDVIVEIARRLAVGKGGGGKYQG